MLLDFLNSAKRFLHINFVIYRDRRFPTVTFEAPNIAFHDVKFIERPLVEFKIKKIAALQDLVIYFGNIPPLFKHKTKVILLLSNRYLIEKYPLNGLPYKTIIQVTVERMLFKLFHKNADLIIVQSFVMQDLLFKMGLRPNIAKVMPYKNKDTVESSKIYRIPNSFLYVADGLPHKNHRNLIYAWIRLAKEGIWPILYLTLDRNAKIYYWIKELAEEHDLKIEFLEKLPRNELFVYYRKISALIYPSYFESYGLPILEAKYFEVPIIASELDYVRDMLDPTETFDPHSSKSISRAIKRFLKQEEHRYDIITADSFINEIIEWANNT